MSNRLLTIITTTSLVLFLVVSTFLPFISFEGYSIFSNTTSHLGAQGSPFAWVMNGVFILLGIAAILKTYPSRISYTRTFGLFFGLSLIMTGIFQHASLTGSVQINQLHDTLHSVFATATGFSFTLLAAGHAVMSKGAQRYAALIMAVIAIVVPLAMFSFPSLMGISQRFMFISAFSWLFFYYKHPVIAGS